MTAPVEKEGCLHTITSCPPSNLSVHIPHFLLTHTHTHTHTHIHRHCKKLNVTDSRNCSLVTDQSGITALLTASLRLSLSDTHTHQHTSTHTHTHTHHHWASTGLLSGCLTVNERCDIQSAQIKPVCGLPPDNGRTSSALSKCGRRSLTVSLHLWLLLTSPLTAQWTKHFPLLVTANTMLCCIYMYIFIRGFDELYSWFECLSLSATCLVYFEAPSWQEDKTMSLEA